MKHIVNYSYCTTKLNKVSKNYRLRISGLDSLLPARMELRVWYVFVDVECTRTLSLSLSHILFSICLWAENYPVGTSSLCSYSEKDLCLLTSKGLEVKLSTGGIKTRTCKGHECNLNRFVLVHSTN